jgi:hypothetical protein
MWPTFFIPFRIKPRSFSYFYLTTPPYPVEVTEKLQASLPNMFSVPSASSADTMQPSCSFIGGTITNVTYEDGYANDSLQCSAAFVSGTVQNFSYENGYAEDSMQCSAAFISGTLERLLVSYTNWPTQPEGLQVSSSFLSGSLT